MVDFLSLYQPAILKALLTERMFGQKLVTNTLPTPAVTLLYGWVTLVFLVSCGFR